MYIPVFVVVVTHWEKCGLWQRSQGRKAVASGLNVFEKLHTFRVQKGSGPIVV